MNKHYYYNNYYYSLYFAKFILLIDFSRKRKDIKNFKRKYPSLSILFYFQPWVNEISMHLIILHIITMFKRADDYQIIDVTRESLANCRLWFINGMNQWILILCGYRALAFYRSLNPQILHIHHWNIIRLDVLLFFAAVKLYSRILNYKVLYHYINNIWCNLIYCENISNAPALEKNQTFPKQVVKVMYGQTLHHKLTWQQECHNF